MRFFNGILFAGEKIPLMISNDFSPLIRIIPIPPSPKGVEIAAIVSSIPTFLIIFSHKIYKNKIIGLKLLLCESTLFNCKYIKIKPTYVG